MRVLHLIDHFGLGGAQTVVNGILTSDKEQDCFAIRSKENQTTNMENVYFSKSGLKLNILTLFKFKKRILENDYLILHCHLFAGYLYGYFLKRLWFHTIALIFHEHGRVFRNNWFYNFFLKHTQNKIELFIAVSEATKRKLMENAAIPEEKIKVLYNFVDLEKFNPDILRRYDRNRERAKIGIEKEDFVIGFAGRLVKTKGWEEFIKSAKILSEENSKLKFLIVGNGPDKQKLINLIYKLGLSDKVFYIGFVPDIRFFYSMIDCFAMPSHWEPLGITEIEAQACSIPIIASDVEGLNEVVSNKKNGLLFKPKDEKDLAEKIELMEKNKELRERLIKNGLHSVKRYSLEEYILSLEKIYEAV
jgi:glycosyltransferase involved in cell wall biosynthesis